MRKRLVPIAVGLAVVAVIAVEALTAGSNGVQGKPAPPLPGAVLQAPAVTLADLRGHPSLVVFWASWCDPCRKEAPAVRRLSRSLPPGARLVTVDYDDQAGGARSFLRRYGWTMPVLSDPSGAYGARYEFNGLPTSFAIDAGGRIAAVLRGPQTESSLRGALVEAARQR